MAVQRDSSYRAYAPADILALLDELAEKGIDGRNPVWSVGRLDERQPGNGNGHSNGNGNGNGGPDAEASATANGNGDD